MKKYTKPSVEVVELSVKESLSALPASFGGKSVGFGSMGTLSGATRKNVTLYKLTSVTTTPTGV